MEKGKVFTQAEPAQFTGTENWYEHSLAMPVHYTDGMLLVAERAGAYWHIDAVALSQREEAALASEEFLVWSLIVEGSSALLRCEAGIDRRLVERRIEYPDFPEPGIKFYAAGGVIMLAGVN